MKSRKLRAPAAYFRWSGICAALVSLALLGGCQKRAAQPEVSGAGSKSGPAQITIENGKTLITLDAPTQKRLGLTSEALNSTVSRAQARFPVVVVSVQELATFRNGYVASQAQLQKARLQAAVSGQEYARLKALSGPEQNVSEKSLQAAQAAMQSNEADVRAGEQQLELQAAALRQEWGAVVTNWATQGSAQFQRIFERGRERGGEHGGAGLGQALVEMTMPAESAFAPPASILLELPDGSRSPARFVSSFPRVDPRIQGRSYLYLAPGRAELSPGLNLMAYLSLGRPLKGVVIPASAVIWSEGKAWVYEQVSANGFSRSPVSTEIPVDNGYFAGEGFSSGVRIVTVGAQALLSEEMLLHSQGGGDGDDD
jgi:hypothetical protein